LEAGKLDKIYIVIPAYNEEANIETVACEWHEIVAQIGAESRLLIVDDGSKDSTYSKLQDLQPELPQLMSVSKANGGHGAAVLFAYNYALEHDADYVFQTDSDGQTLPKEFWDPWENREDYDIQIGFRKGRQDGFLRVVVTKTLKLVLFLQFGLKITDANTPFRLMSATSLKEVIHKVPKDHNLANVVLTVLYHRGKKRIRYFPITFRPRQGGVNSINILKIIMIGWKAIMDFGSLKKSLRKVA
jgi:glycosyltransferase involved in cell wall biosynthesis